MKVLIESKAHTIPEMPREHWGFKCSTGKQLLGNFRQS